MSLERDEIASTLAARQYLYAMFQSLFGTEPNTDQGAVLEPSLRAEAWAAAGMSVPAGDESIDVVQADPQAWVGEYNRLFVGPAFLPSPPWESVFASNSDVLFGHGTLEVRSEYRAQGFIPQLYPTVADDHVALELGFMALMAQKSIGAWDEMCTQDASTALKVSERFLKRHLGWWIGSWAERLAKAEPDSPYTAMAQAAVTFVQADMAGLSTLIQTIEVCS